MFYAYVGIHQVRILVFDNYYQTCSVPELFPFIIFLYCAETSSGVYSHIGLFSGPVKLPWLHRTSFGLLALHHGRGRLTGRSVYHASPLRFNFVILQKSCSNFKTNKVQWEPSLQSQRRMFNIQVWTLFFLLPNWLPVNCPCVTWPL